MQPGSERRTTGSYTELQQPEEEPKVPQPEPSPVGEGSPAGKAANLEPYAGARAWRGEPPDENEPAETASGRLD